MTEPHRAAPSDTEAGPARVVVAAGTVVGVEGATRLEHATWPTVEASRPLVVVPVGSCEQHGPHLPLGTDSIIAETLAERAAERIDHAVVGPTLTVTASGEHQGFPGTLSIGSAVMEEVVVELVRSADWARGVVLVNGHGGNHAAVKAAVARLVAEDRRVLAWWPRVADGDLHAGRTETSLVLAVRPDLVDESSVTGETGTGSSIDPAMMTELHRHGVRMISADGVIGRPSDATAAHGADLLDHLVADLCDRIVRWSGTSAPTGSDPA